MSKSTFKEKLLKTLNQGSTLLNQHLVVRGEPVAIPKNYLHTVAARIANIEGKKSQARIGDIKEILAIMGSLAKEENKLIGEPMLRWDYLISACEKSAERRAKRK